VALSKLDPVPGLKAGSGFPGEKAALGGTG